ncbi:hypothetical protein GCM10017566_71010 [Amycolatopsis bartoniae]|uniref:Uncharacterized protein n=1 Tax=Amycolatopsis bartoniae TaxID=941986 RepID=A0A8H9MFY5_9PSEU|nr:hypothetical protein GCM10017566_71010 [Amycolatopsis bartoniae]
MYDPVEITVICAVLLELDDEDAALAELPPCPPACPPEPLPDDDAELLLLPDPPAETCCPTVRLTAATVPAMGEVSVASESAVCALSSWFWAAVIDASSASICAEDAPFDWSDDSFDWSEARLDLACATLADSDADCTVASACPAVTCWPTVTFTAVTCPDTPKFRSLRCAGSIVPDDETVCFNVVVLAATSRYDGAAAGRVSTHVVIPAATSTTTTTVP